VDLADSDVEEVEKQEEEEEENMFQLVAAEDKFIHIGFTSLVAKIQVFSKICFIIL